jgi:hypothetical protein
MHAHARAHTTVLCLKYLHVCDVELVFTQCSSAYVINYSTSIFLVSSFDSLLDEKLCQVTVKVLGASSSPEVIEMCLELLHGQAENGNSLFYSVVALKIQRRYHFELMCLNVCCS